MFDLRPLVRPDFWFASHPTSLMSSSSRVLLLFFTLLLVIGAVVRLVSRKRFTDRYVLEAYGRVGRMLSTMGFLGLVWLFFAVEQVTFLQARYWALVWFIGFIVWVIFIWKYVFQTVPAERERHHQDRERMKYLPGHRH